MVQFRVSFTVLTFLLIFIASLSSLPAAIAGKEQADTSHGTWQKQPWMNHGSDRGPRKHLVDLTAYRPFQVPKLPV
ncbi:hypothetical protein BT93_D2215 [Corymbia citriodora subsp. variegata]|nr:hypothetical protein BT93_D2215 [Corymbia citriodora subsp. variegata]